MLAFRRLIVEQLVQRRSSVFTQIITLGETAVDFLPYYTTYDGSISMDSNYYAYTLYKEASADTSYTFVETRVYLP